MFLKIRLLSLCALLGASLMACGAIPADAQVTAQDNPAPWRETWVGADAGANYWSVYTATVWSPYGPVTAPGLRFRVGSAYSHYSYDSSRLIAGRTVATRFNGTGTSADALIGYQWQLGTLTAKLYGGIAAAQYTVSPFDPGSDVDGFRVGAAAAAELWWNVRPDIWTSLDLTASTASPFASATARLGWRMSPQISLGGEVTAMTDGELHRSRLGALIRAEWDRGASGIVAIGAGEGTIAGGVALDEKGDAGAWGRIGLLMRY